MTPTVSARSRLERLLRVEASSKPVIYAETFDASEIASLNYLLELLLSAGIATLGLVLNSPAVVIGAMLISPLMGPILGGGLALAAADVYLGLKAMLNIVASVGLAVGFSALLVWLLPFQSPTSEILARTRPNLLDLGVALLSGLAGALVVGRGSKAGGISALPGVAVAVALMPPLCTMGFGIGSGFSWPIIYGAGLLFLTNLAAIVASAFFVFYVIRMDAPDIRSGLDESIRARAARDWLYRALQRTRFAGAFRAAHSLQWRIVMVLTVLLVLFVPLRRGLLQVRDETIARGAAREVIRTLTPPANVLVQTVDVGKDRVSVQLIVTSHIDPKRVAAAERTILRRTGKDATIAIRRVAAEEELAVLRAELTRPAPPPPPAPPAPLALEAARKEFLARLDAPLKEIWPADAAMLESDELVLTADGVIVGLTYRAPKDLDAAFVESLTRFLRTRLGNDTLSVSLQREREEPSSRAKTRPRASAPPGAGTAKR